jgi:Arc/MetJ-type ribon-helix-helix transcriptional regulator
MVRTQIQLPEQQVTALKNLASRQHTSMAELIRRAIDLFTAAADAVDIQEQRQRALAAAGQFRSGRGDLAASHDDYLAEAYK